MKIQENVNIYNLISFVPWEDGVYLHSSTPLLCSWNNTIFRETASFLSVYTWTVSHLLVLRTLTHWCKCTTTTLKCYKLFHSPPKCTSSQTLKANNFHVSWKTGFRQLEVDIILLQRNAEWWGWFQSRVFGPVRYSQHFKPLVSPLMGNCRSSQKS